MHFTRMAAAVGLVVGLSTASLAKVESLEGASLGEHWAGPKRSVDELKGRVVLIELWGFN